MPNKSNDIPTGHYKCAEHGEFSVEFETTADATWEQPCPECGAASMWDPQVPADIYVKHTWEQKANMLRGSKRTQMDAQLKSVKDAQEAKKKYGDEREAFR